MLQCDSTLKPRYEYTISSNQHALSGHALKCALLSYSSEWANVYYHRLLESRETWCFKPYRRSKNRIPEPNSRTEFQNRIHVIQTLNFSSPIPRTSRKTWSKSPMNQCIIPGAHPMQNAHRKVPVFQVNIPWGEPQSYSWSIGYMSTSFRFIYSPRKNPGKRPTNLFVYHVHGLRSICAI